MTHTHKIEKVKEGQEFDSNGSGYLVVSNIAGRPIVIGKPAVSLYPGDKAYSCDDNESVLTAVKSGKLKIVESFEAKAKTKKQKQEEPKQEETLATVADVEEEVSVQLGLSDEGDSSLSDTL
jgi:hypothetical protein